MSTKPSEIVVVLGVKARNGLGLGDPGLPSVVVLYSGLGGLRAQRQ